MVITILSHLTTLFCLFLFGCQMASSSSSGNSVNINTICNEVVSRNKNCFVDMYEELCLHRGKGLKRKREVLNRFTYSLTYLLVGLFSLAIPSTCSLSSFRSTRLSIKTKYHSLSLTFNVCVCVCIYIYVCLFRLSLFLFLSL